jgi:hypothetical protein
MCMWGRKYAQGASKTTSPVSTEKSNKPKYSKPKLLLIDMDDLCVEKLRQAGYDVSIGTFGKPHRVERSSDLNYVSLESFSLPNYEEQEIIIVNIQTPEPVDLPSNNVPGKGVDVFWQEGIRGLIDPRPPAMSYVRSAFDKIQCHGGIFIVFAAAIEKNDYYYGSISRARQFGAISNWTFLEELQHLEVQNHYGWEITFDPTFSRLTTPLLRAQEGAEYYCIMSPDYYREDHWIPLAKNKYDEDVAGMLVYEQPKGCIVILPQMPAIHSIILELLEDWCAEVNPSLFPHLEGSRWVHRSEYEIPLVVKLQKEIETIEAESKGRIKDLQAKIESIRKEKADWYTLLRGSGDDLVQAVIRSLRCLGFKEIVDADAGAKRPGNKSPRREDIQVHDCSPVLIIDVKGVRGRPDDNESRQAEKHAIMRMQEWKRTDVKPVTIINSERHLPPHDRCEKSYRDEIIEYAKQTQLGLMTTWDLFRLLRNAEKLGWPPEVLRPVLYRVGRIDPIPEHYQEIGRIVKVWENAFGIIPNVSISVGDLLAVEVGDTFIEFNVDSLKVEDQTMQTAQAGSNCGIRFSDDHREIKEQARVFRVISVTSHITT